VDQHLHVYVSFFLEDVEPIDPDFSETLPDLDNRVLVMWILGLVLEVGLPLLDLGGVDLVAVLVLHVIVLV